MQMRLFLGSLAVNKDKKMQNKNAKDNDFYNILRFFDILTNFSINAS